MNIIKTGIADPGADVFWDSVSSITKDATARPVLIIVQNHQPGNVESAQLQKMLDASGLKQEQYNIISIGAEVKAGWYQIREQLNPKFIFMLGVMPAQLGITALFQAHAPNRFNDRVWLPTLSLAELEQQPAVKKQLWVSGMKPMFVDKVYGELSE